MPEDLQDPAAALPIAQRAVEMDGGQNANILDTLAVAYKMTGHLDRAIETQQKAVARARAVRAYNCRELEQRLVDFLLKKGEYVEAGRVIVEQLRGPWGKAGTARPLEEEGLSLEEFNDNP